MSISIIIPTYNRMPVLKEVLPSYLAQPGVEEIIIVDDCSRDGTETMIKEMIKEQSRLKYCRLEKHRGLPAARNAGIKQASGDYILFGEDDIFFETNHTSQLMECMQRTKADIIAGRLLPLRSGETKEEALSRKDKFQGPLINNRLIFGNFWKKTKDDEESLFVHACALIKKEVFNKLLYDENFLGNGWREETDFYLRAGKEGYKIYFCPHALAYHMPRGYPLSGGCMGMGIFVYQYWALRNNYIFLRKHYQLLKDKLTLDYSKWQLIMAQVYLRVRHCVGHLLEEWRRRQG